MSVIFKTFRKGQWWKNRKKKGTRTIYLPGWHKNVSVQNFLNIKCRHLQEGPWLQCPECCGRGNQDDDTNLKAFQRNSSSLMSFSDFFYLLYTQCQNWNWPFVWNWMNFGKLCSVILSVNEQKIFLKFCELFDLWNEVFFSINFLTSLIFILFAEIRIKHFLLGFLNVGEKWHWL